LSVIERIESDISAIYVVDDECPEKTGNYVIENCNDKRVIIIKNSVNQGVGGATIEGYKIALQDGMDILVKLDGDGQMDPAFINVLTAKIKSGQADYTKGNRFFNLDKLITMPRVRIIGNSILSFVTKISSGYWNIFDPTNGYIAIHSDVLKLLPLEKLSKRYFFESDMLFRLNTLHAVVVDVPIDPIYGDEHSNFKISENIFKFIKGHIRNTAKRIFYNYYLRNFSIASLELLLSVLLLSFGGVFGLYKWHQSYEYLSPASAGTVMLAALPIIIGFQLLLSFLNYDINSTPRIPISNVIKK
jgi:hypothetical protein